MANREVFEEHSRPRQDRAASGKHLRIPARAASADKRIDVVGKEELGYDSSFLDHGVETMVLNIDDPEAERLARETIALTGETLAETVVIALRERLSRVQGPRDPEEIRREIREIQERFAARRVMDSRSDDEILGYDEHGLPT